MAGAKEESVTIWNVDYPNVGATLTWGEALAIVVPEQGDKVTVTGPNVVRAAQRLVNATNTALNAGGELSLKPPSTPKKIVTETELLHKRLQEQEALIAKLTEEALARLEEMKEVLTEDEEALPPPPPPEEGSEDSSGKNKNKKAAKASQPNDEEGKSAEEG